MRCGQPPPWTCRRPNEPPLSSVGRAHAAADRTTWRVRSRRCRLAVGSASVRGDLTCFHVHSSSRVAHSTQIERKNFNATVLLHPPASVGLSLAGHLWTTYSLLLRGHCERLFDLQSAQLPQNPTLPRSSSLCPRTRDRRSRDLTTEP